MTFHPSTFIKRIVSRLGLNPRQEGYFFRIPNLRSEKGSLIALAAIFMVVIAVLVPVAMSLVQITRANTQRAQQYVAVAQNAAKAGLEDALGYFVRQNKLMSAFPSQIMEATPTVFASGISYVDQPFNPIYNTTNAVYSDTFQATTQISGGTNYPFFGLCNEYPLDASSNTMPVAGQVTSVYFARYEVQEQTNPLATPGANTPTPNSNAVHDISGSRVANYMNGDGLTWAITSTGYMYQRKSYTMDEYGEYTVPYNVYPNKVLATVKAYTEFRKLSCTLPNQPSSGVSYASVYCSAGSDVTLGGFSYMGGSVPNGYGLCAMAGATTIATPTGAAATNFFGAGIAVTSGTTAPEGSVHNAPISDVTVFGMSLKDIQFIADYVGSPSIPMTILEPYKLAYFNGNVTYGASQSSTIYQQLNSTGIFCVNGNLVLESSAANSGGSIVAASYYSGIVFCTGNVSIGAGCQLDGSLILGYSAASTNTSPPTLTAPGGGTGAYSYMTADPQAVKNVIQLVAQYREDISARKVLLAFPGI